MNIVYCLYGIGESVTSSEYHFPFYCSYHRAPSMAKYIPGNSDAWMGVIPASPLDRSPKQAIGQCFRHHQSAYCLLKPVYLVTQGILCIVCGSVIYYHNYSQVLRILYNFFGFITFEKFTGGGFISLYVHIMVCLMVWLFRHSWDHFAPILTILIGDFSGDTSRVRCHPRWLIFWYSLKLHSKHHEKDQICIWFVISETQPLIIQKLPKLGSTACVWSWPHHLQILTVFQFLFYHDNMNSTLSKETTS